MAVGRDESIIRLQKIQSKFTPFSTRMGDEYEFQVDMCMRMDVVFGNWYGYEYEIFQSIPDCILDCIVKTTKIR